MTREEAIAILAEIEKHGLQWFPMLLAGSGYALPPWLHAQFDPARAYQQSPQVRERYPDPTVAFDPLELGGAMTGEVRELPDGVMFHDPELEPMSLLMSFVLPVLPVQLQLRLHQCFRLLLLPLRPLLHLLLHRSRSRKDLEFLQVEPILASMATSVAMVRTRQ